jgi:hypothetical protein
MNHSQPPVPALAHKTNPFSWRELSHVVPFLFPWWFKIPVYQCPSVVKNSSEIKESNRNQTATAPQYIQFTTCFREKAAKLNNAMACTAPAI